MFVCLFWVFLFVCLFVVADAPSAAVMDDIAAKQRKIMPKKKVDKKKLRMAGGKVWRDETLDDWDPSKLIGGVEKVESQGFIWRGGGGQ